MPKDVGSQSLKSLNNQTSPRGDSHGLWPSWPFRVELQAFCLRMQQSDSGSTTVVRVFTWATRDRKTEIKDSYGWGWGESRWTFVFCMNLLPLWRIGSLIFLRTEVANAMELECRNFKGLDVRLKPTEFDVSQQVRRWSFCCCFHMMTQDHQVWICPETSGIQKPNVTKHLLCLQLRLIVFFFVSYDIN